MATFEVTEFGEAAVTMGNGAADPPLPFIKHGTVTTGPGNEYQLQPGTRLIMIDRASGDLRFKLGRMQADVAGGNAPTASNSPQMKSTDQPRRFTVPKAGSGGWWIGSV